LRLAVEARDSTDEVMNDIKGDTANAASSKHQPSKGGQGSPGLSRGGPSPRASGRQPANAPPPSPPNGIEAACPERRPGGRLAGPRILSNVKPDTGLAGAGPGKATARGGRHEIRAGRSSPDHQPLEILLRRVPATTVVSLTTSAPISGSCDCPPHAQACSRCERHRVGPRPLSLHRRANPLPRRF
jgi:hypothetical protein